MNKFVGKLTVFEIFVWTTLLVVLVFTVLPLVFMATASFMDSKQILSMPYGWIPSSKYFSKEGRTFLTNFKKAIMGNSNNPTFFRNMFNSLVVAATVSVSSVVLASLCGYGLAKFNFKGKTIVFLSIMATMMIPFEAIMIPLYMVVAKMKMLNTYQGLILPFLVSAFAVFQMRQYLVSFPSEFLDAARVDGLSELGIYSKIVIPNSMPVIATVSILSFKSQWDMLLWPLLVSQMEKMKTITQYITKFSEEVQTDEGAMMACAFLASIPMLILFFRLSSFFIGGADVQASRKG